MSTPNKNQKNVNFSRKCRDRVNFFFQKLKISLKKIPTYQSKNLNWNRFEILERALQQIQVIDGIFKNSENELATSSNFSSERKDLNNKELCQLYRTRLNLGFDKLRNILEQKPELAQYRLFSRAGLLEATVHYLETKSFYSTVPSEPTKCLKRERSEDDDLISPNKIPKPYFPVQSNRLNTSTGLDSPDSGFSPPDGAACSTAMQASHLYSMELARAQLYAYNRLILLRTQLAQNSTQNLIQVESESTSNETASVWRPW